MSPPNDDSDLKEIFHHMVREGAGRPVDEQGFSVGPWTPDTLADAICQLEANQAGIDLRSVQRWFQHNDRGIKIENLRWLALVFGCGDAEASSKWQVALVAASTKLAAKRRANQFNKTTNTLEPIEKIAPLSKKTPNVTARSDSNEETEDQSNATSFGFLCRSIFVNQHPLTLPSMIWAGLTALAFMTFIFGVQSITYRAAEGLDKQVGFLWAPSWTLLPLLILPAFLIIVSRILDFWESVGRFETVDANRYENFNPVSWKTKIGSFSWLFLIVSVVSFGLIFLLQWSGVHLRALLNNDAAGYMMDWNIVAIVRPDVISNLSSIIISCFAYLFFGILMWFLFAGLVLLLAISNDYFELCRTPQLRSGGVDHDRLYKAGAKIVNEVYRCSVLAILFVTCIKLQSTYLISTGETLSSWLVKDGMAFLSSQQSQLGFLDQRGIPQFTSLLLLILIIVIFLICLFQISAVVGGTTLSEVFFNLKLCQWRMIAVIGLLTSNVVLIGLVDGFSLLLLISLIVALVSLYDSKLNLR